MQRAEHTKGFYKNSISFVIPLEIDVVMAITTTSANSAGPFAPPRPTSFVSPLKMSCVTRSTSSSLADGSDHAVRYN